MSRSYLGIRFGSAAVCSCYGRYWYGRGHTVINKCEHEKGRKKGQESKNKVSGTPVKSRKISWTGKAGKSGYKFTVKKGR